MRLGSAPKIGCTAYGDREGHKRAEVAGEAGQLFCDDDRRIRGFPSVTSRGIARTIALTPETTTPPARTTPPTPSVWCTARRLELINSVCAKNNTNHAVDRAP